MSLINCYLLPIKIFLKELYSIKIIIYFRVRIRMIKSVKSEVIYNDYVLF